MSDLKNVKAQHFPTTGGRAQGGGVAPNLKVASALSDNKRGAKSLTLKGVPVKFSKGWFPWSKKEVNEEIKLDLVLYKKKGKRVAGKHPLDYTEQEIGELIKANLSKRRMKANAETINDAAKKAYEAVGEQNELNKFEAEVMLTKKLVSAEGMGKVKVVIVGSDLNPVARLSVEDIKRHINRDTKLADLVAVRNVQNDGSLPVNNPSGKATREGEYIYYTQLNDDQLESEAIRIQKNIRKAVEAENGERYTRRKNEKKNNRRVPDKKKLKASQAKTSHKKTTPANKIHKSINDGQGRFGKSLKEASKNAEKTWVPKKDPDKKKLKASQAKTSHKKTTPANKIHKSINDGQGRFGKSLKEASKNAEKTWVPKKDPVDFEKIHNDEVTRSTAKLAEIKRKHGGIEAGDKNMLRVSRHLAKPDHQNALSKGSHSSRPPRARLKEMSPQQRREVQFAEIPKKAEPGQP